jgi:geranylgeranyl pyrophosphate synthase
MVNNQLKTRTYISPVQDRINQVERRMREVTNGYNPELKVALDHLLSSGGKRVRPTAAILTGEMLGADPEKIISLAAAIELLHTATLVHDDLIDGSRLRRGFPTLNAQWTPAATVLTGDFIFACAARLAAETESVELMRIFAQTLSTIVNGEVTQLFSRSSSIYYEDYLERIYAKTASLFELATMAAAMLSPLSGETIDPAQRFGYGIGMAFQIIDDVLDFTGVQDAVGKPVANDLRQGLITLPTIYYYRSHPDDPDLNKLLNGLLIADKRITNMADAIQNSDAIQQSISKAESFIIQALDALEELPHTDERGLLEELANYIVNRQH